MYPIDDAMGRLTADHAESMMEHEILFTYGYLVYEEILRVPLRLGSPGVESVRHGASASEIAEASYRLRPLGHWRTAAQGSRKWVIDMKRGVRGIREVPKQLLARSQSDTDPRDLPEDAREGMRLDAPKVASRATPMQLEQFRARGYVE